MWFVIIGKGNAFFHVKTLLSRKFGGRCVFCGNVMVVFLFLIKFAPHYFMRFHAHDSIIIIYYAIVVRRESDAPRRCG